MLLVDTRHASLFQWRNDEISGACPHSSDVQLFPIQIMLKSVTREKRVTKVTRSAPYKSSVGQFLTQEYEKSARFLPQ